MSNLNPIVGIYYSVGSKDIPHGYNPNLNYGFDGSNPVPIFKYSLTNVNNFFYKPLNCRRLRNGEIQTLTIEEIPDVGMIGLTPQEFEDNGFNALFEALNILYDRSDVTDEDIVYDSKGDRLLSEASLQDRYKAGSLYMEFATLDTELRISYVKLKFRLYDNVEHTTISVYFIPDIMFERNAFDTPQRYDISYTTKNTPNTEEGLISVLAEGPQSLLQFEKVRNYTNVCKLVTQFNVFVNEEIIDTYDRTFFIHNLMYKGFELSPFQKILIIKRYLDNKYLIYGDSRRRLLNIEYPELFTSNSIDIFPIMTPRLEGRFCSVVSNDTIRREIQRRGITIDLTNEESAKRIEIIMIEGINTSDNNNYITSTSKANRNFIVPIMAVSNDSTAYNGVIYSNFNYYAPTFTGYIPNGETWEQFHFYLKLIVKLATGMLPWIYKGVTDEGLTLSLKLPVNLHLKTERVIINGSEFINSISFDFLEITYTVNNFFKYGVI